MVEVLRSRWRLEMSWDDVIKLRDELDVMLKSIRKSRNIIPVATSTLCPCCQKPMFQGMGGVSVLATIHALRRFGIAEEDKVEAMAKDWSKYRKVTGIDRDGRCPS